MNLINSIIVSLLIVMTFWALALPQSSIANAIQVHKEDSALLRLSQNDEKIMVPLTKVSIKPDTVHIAGLKQNIPLKNIHLLWKEFNNTHALHESLKSTPNKVYVLYSDLSKTYQQADVTIGYDVNELSQFSKHYSININNQSFLLPAKKYNENQLANAWSKINYSKKIRHVLEVHTLNEAGETRSTQMFVKYK